MFDEASTKSMIEDEVRRFGERKGWKWQVRRDWAVREKPVKESNIFDYEWKLIPCQVRGRESVAGSVSLDKREFDFEGWYYVLRLRDERTLELSHGNDWAPGDGMGGWWSDQSTCTIINLSAVRRLSDMDRVLQSEWDPVTAQGAHSPSEAQQGRHFKLDRSRDSGSGHVVGIGSIALSNWLIIMTDRYGPNFYFIT